TAPTSLLNASGDRPVYNSRAARFFSDASLLPEDVLVTGGIAGDGGVEELTGQAAAVGAEAARRAARIAAARIAATPTRSPAAPAAPGAATDAGPEASVRHIPELPVDAHPELFTGRPNGFVDFSEYVSAKDRRAAVAEGYG